MREGDWINDDPNPPLSSQAYKPRKENTTRS